MPSELRLRLGLARGTAARIGGMTSGFFGWDRGRIVILTELRRA
ncbi:hypothetical protein [Rhodococcus globerulus]|nr:hypothetical protein [Rhodococcus globerulus]